MGLACLERLASRARHREATNVIAWHRQAFPVQNRVLSATVLRTFAVGLLSAVLKRLWISSKDLEAIQKRALEEGLPYQTLIASLLHKFASGRLKEA